MLEIQKLSDKEIEGEVIEFQNAIQINVNLHEYR